MDRQEQIFYHSTILLENDILHIQFAKDIVINEQIAKEIVSVRKDAFGVSPRPMFIDVNNILSIDKQAQLYLAGEEAWEYITAGAIFTDNKVLEILGRTWIMINNPTLPVNIFSYKMSALEWLQSHRPVTGR